MSTGLMVRYALLGNPAARLISAWRAIAVANVGSSDRRAAVDRALADADYRAALELAAAAQLDATPLVLAAREWRRS